MVVLVGDNVDTAVPVVLPADAFGRLPATRCKTLDAIIGIAGHGAAPPVCRSGPHAPAKLDVDELRVRGVFLLSSGQNAAALTTHPTGRFSFPSFHNTFLTPKSLLEETAQTLWPRSSNSTVDAAPMAREASPS